MDVSVIPANDLVWQFHTEPGFHIKDRNGNFNCLEIVDPFPCYQHSVEAVKSIAQRVTDIVPLSGQLDIYCPAYESPNRTSGFYSQFAVWGKDDPYGGYIVLNGKRIPPHPAMTRYLVSHEYGHAVQYWIEWKYKVKSLPEAYCKELRAYEGRNEYYGGRTWHAAYGEIFANDFRIACTGLESEFWPHEGISRPEDCPLVDKFWRKVRQGQVEDGLAMLPSLEYRKD